MNENVINLGNELKEAKETITSLCSNETALADANTQIAKIKEEAEKRNFEHAQEVAKHLENIEKLNVDLSSKTNSLNEKVTELDNIKKSAQGNLTEHQL